MASCSQYLIKIGYKNFVNWFKLNHISKREVIAAGREKFNLDLPDELYLISDGEALKFNNLISDLRKSGVVRRQRREKRSKSTPGNTQLENYVVDDTLTDVEEQTEEVKIALEWLRYNRSPWPEVEEKWKQTAKHRLKSVTTSTDKNLKTYFEDWPVLKLHLGYTLINLDFQVLFPNKETNLFCNWGNISKKVENQLETILLPEHMRNLLKSEAKDCAVIWLLPNLLKPALKRKSPEQKGVWKPSLEESRESLVLHVKTSNDLEPALERRRNKLQEQALTHQPQIVVVGPSLTDINSYFVVLDNLKYKVDSFVSALDLTFKMFHVFHLAYPVESELIWMFIQKSCYNIDTKWDKNVSRIKTFMGDLGL